MVSIEKEGDKATAERIQAIRDGFRSRWEKMETQHRNELCDFAHREESVFGRVENAFRGLDLKDMVREGNPTDAFRNLFGAFSSSGARLEGIRRKQEKERKALEREQKGEERLAKAEESRVTHQKKSYERKQLFSHRADLMLKQNMDKAYIRTSWRKRDADRRESWSKLVQSQNLKQEFNRAAKPKKSKKDTKQTDFDYYKQLADQINRSDQSLSRDFDRGR